MEDMDALVDRMKRKSLSLHPDERRRRRKGIIGRSSEENGGALGRSRQSTAESTSSNLSGASSASFASMTAGPSREQLLGGGSSTGMVRDLTLKASGKLRQKDPGEEEDWQMVFDAELAVRLAVSDEQEDRTPARSLDEILRGYSNGLAVPARTSSLRSSSSSSLSTDQQQQQNSTYPYPPTDPLFSKPNPYLTIPTPPPFKTSNSSSSIPTIRHSASTPATASVPPLAPKSHIKSIEEIILQHAGPTFLSRSSSLPSNGASSAAPTPAQAIAASARSGARGPELLPVLAGAAAGDTEYYYSSAEDSSRHSMDSVEEEVKSTLRNVKQLKIPKSSSSSTTTTPLHHSKSFPNNPRLDLSSTMRDSDESPTKDRSPGADVRSIKSSANTTRQGSHNGNPSLESDEFAVERELARLLTQPRLTRLLTLKRPPNQRLTVSLADVGSPSGHPVIVFLGLGCVRYLVALYDEIAEAFGLRLICVDRWGLGRTGSVPDNERGFMEWASVFSEVVDELGLESYSLLAHSAGGPYALAASLKNPERVKGSIHLLAPWVSTAADSLAGPYKYLKYVPTGVIKTAQAAEFKIQGWRLGKPPTIMHDPIEFNHKAPVSSSSVEAAWVEEELGDGASDADNSLSPTLGGGNYPAGRVAVNGKRLKPKSSRSFLGGIFGTDRTPKSSSSSTSGSSRPGTSRSHTTPPSTISLGTSPSPTHGKAPRTRRASITSLASSMRRTPPPHHPTPTSPLSADSSSISSPSPTIAVSPTSGIPISSLSSTELVKGLLRASYAESLKGTTSDLMVLLERTSKPWGFKYSDVETPVKIWQGEKDERISLASIKSLGKELKNCRMALVEGADHSLMTNGQVMCEVLESIADEWAGRDGNSLIT